MKYWITAGIADFTGSYPVSEFENLRGYSPGERIDVINV